MRVDDVRGVFGIVPTPATDDATDLSVSDTVDTQEASRVAAALAGAGLGAIMGAGTLGEGATLTQEELGSFARATVAGADGACPVLLGPTALGTRETLQRAAVLAEAGVDGFLLGRPMWCALGTDAIVDFYGSVADAFPDHAIVVYDNPVAFGGKIPTEAYRQLAEIQQVVAAKYSLLTSAYLDDVEAVGDGMRLLLIDFQWYHGWLWAPEANPACWSSGVGCGPAAVLALAEAIERGDGDHAVALTRSLREAMSWLYPDGDVEQFLRFNIPIDKAMFAEAGFLRPGAPRPPYHLAPERLLEGGRRAGRELAALHRRFAGGS